jgi:general secretion pathway protein G
MDHAGELDGYLPLRGRWLVYFFRGVPILLLLWLNIYQEYARREAAWQHGSVVVARVQLNSFRTAIELYRIDHEGKAPTSAEGLRALIQPPLNQADARRWKGPYLNDVTTVPLDPWNHPYVYHSPGTEGEPFEITCYGADGQPEGEGINEDLSTTKR